MMFLLLNKNTMKKITFLILFFTATFLAHSQNLILNPSAEEPAINGEIPHWTETIGSSWVATNDAALFNFEANTVPNGDSWFWAGNNVQNVGGLNVSEIEQIINITSDASAIDLGTKNYFFSGYTRSFEQGLNDESNIFIEYLDVNNVILNTFTFGPFSTSSSWINVTGILLAPINARKIRIKLHTILRSGSDNDGCYDDLYLGSVPLLRISKNKHNESDIVIFPNPSTGIFNIQTTKYIENVSLKVFDLNGRMIHQTKPENLENKILDLTNLQNGTYILDIENEDYNYSQKIIKQ